MGAQNNVEMLMKAFAKEILRVERERERIYI
jgi:hypothetical protein